MEYDYGCNYDDGYGNEQDQQDQPRTDAMWFEIRRVDQSDILEWDDDGKPMTPPQDEDGYFCGFNSDSMFSDVNSVEVLVQDGVSPQTTAKILRKLADQIECHGTDIMAAGRNIGGHFTPEGDLVVYKDEMEE